MSVLTRDQRIAALEVADNLCADLCCYPIRKAGEGRVLPFENAVVELLLTEWGNASKKAVQEALNRLGDALGPVTARELSQIFMIIEGGIRTRFVEGSNNGMPKYIHGAYSKGKKDVFKAFKHKVSWSQVDDTAVEWLTDHHMYWIGNYYNRQVSDTLASVVAEGMEEGLGRKDIGEKIRGFFDEDNYPGVGSKPEAYWRGLAANAMNRTRNFAMIQAYDEVGVTKLQIVAVMDERTSPVCRMLNGRVVLLSTAAGQRDMLMAADDPEDVKTISPWVPAKDLEGLSTKAITEKGVIMPPYHFHCRTQVVAA